MSTPVDSVLITVKTYPTLSGRYGETVCTAGLREDGSWVRIYPVPFRLLEEINRYKLFEWIECPMQRNAKDFRPETFRLLDPSRIRRGVRLDTTGNWRARRDIVLKKATVYDRLEPLIKAAKDNTTSLAVFKPSEIVGFVHEPADREWSRKKLEEMRAKIDQVDLFDDNEWRATFRVVNKLPYKFYYRFTDAAGKTSKLQVLEWQIGALFWNCLRQAGGNEEEALAQVRQKYVDEFADKDLHFFLGTTLGFHLVAPNPWMIIGVFPIPYEQQTSFFDSPST